MGSSFRADRGQISVLVHNLAIKQLIPQSRVEGLDKAVFPRRARRDVGCLGPDRRDPLLDRLRNELRAVVGANVAGHATQDEEVGQDIDNVDRFEPSVDPDRQALMGELVDDVEHPVFLSLVGAVLDKIVTPDVVGVFRPQPDAGTIGKPELSLLWLFLWNLEALAPPDALDPLVVDNPAGG
jgi:hypothetical protein